MAPKKSAVAKRARQKSESKTTDKEDRSRRENSGTAGGALVCCTPRGCGEGGTVTLDQNSAVRMVCTNTKCDQGNLMHKACFEAYEEYLLKMLVKSGRSNRMRCTDAQMRQGLWTKIWHITSKFSVCNCGGHLRKDIDWEPAEEEPQAPVPKAGKKKSTEKPSLVGYSNRKGTKGQTKSKLIHHVNNNIKKSGTIHSVKKEEEQAQTDQSYPPAQSCDLSPECEIGDDDDAEPSALLGYLGCSNIPYTLPVDEHPDFGYETYDMHAVSSSNSYSSLPTSTEDNEIHCSNSHPTSPNSELPNSLVECFAVWWVNEGWRECAFYMEQQGLNMKHLISAHELEMTLELTSDPAIPVAKQLEPWLQDEGWQGFVQHYAERSEVTELVGSEFSW